MEATVSKAEKLEQLFFECFGGERLDESLVCHLVYHAILSVSFLEKVQHEFPHIPQHGNSGGNQQEKSTPGSPHRHETQLSG